MADVLTIDDLIADKKHSTFFAEVITGKSGGLAGGADIGTATNQVTGQTQKTVPAIVRDIAFLNVGTFAAGYTLTNTRQTLEYNGLYYSWTGTFPKVVAAGSTPTPLSAGNWVDRSGDILRQELGDKPLVLSYIMASLHPDPNDAYEYALSTGKTIVIDVSITLTRNITKSENEPTDLIFINDAKILGVDYAPRLRSNPEHRLTCTSKRVFFPYRAGDIRFETMFAQDGVAVGRNAQVRQNLVTAYFGADSMDSIYPHIWALNSVTNVHKSALNSVTPGAGAEHFGYELDVNVDTDNTGSGAIVEGLRVAGVGDFSNWPLAYAIHVMRDNSGLYKWPVGVFVEECKTGIYVLNPTVYAALFRGNKPMSFIPNSQESNEIINVRNPADTQSLFHVDDVGRAGVASLSVGNGSAITKVLKLEAPNVGFGNIVSGSAAAKTYVELFGIIDIDLPNSVFRVTASKAGGLPTGVFVDTFYNSTASNAYVRISNLSGATFLNTGITIKVEITQY